MEMGSPNFSLSHLFLGVNLVSSLQPTHPRQGIHCMPRTSDLNEELGQIEYVFSAPWQRDVFFRTNFVEKKMSLFILEMDT